METQQVTISHGAQSPPSVATVVGPLTLKDCFMQSHSLEACGGTSWVLLLPKLLVGIMQPWVKMNQKQLEIPCWLRCNYKNIFLYFWCCCCRGLGVEGGGWGGYGSAPWQLGTPLVLPLRYLTHKPDKCSHARTHKTIKLYFIHCFKVLNYFRIHLVVHHYKESSVVSLRSSALNVSI